MIKDRNIGACYALAPEAFALFNFVQSKGTKFVELKEFSDLDSQWILTNNLLVKTLTARRKNVQKLHSISL